MNFSWLNLSSESAAKRLLGSELVREIDGQTLRVKIVEVEAYDQDDPASHTFIGKTKRNQAMFMAAGHAYVYLIHGLHHCLNVVTGEEGYGSGALIRAVEPLEGAEQMIARRGKGGYDVTNGPGKVGQALSLDLSYSGHSLMESPLILIKQPELLESDITTTTRVGISKAGDRRRRYYIVGNPYVSKK